MAARLENDGIAGMLYIGYPIIGTPDGPFAIDALLLSPETGAVIFDLVEGKSPGDYVNRQDRAATKLHVKLLQHPPLVKKRTLAVPINVVTFAPAIASIDQYVREEYPLCNEQTLDGVLAGLKGADQSLFPALVAVIQSISNLRRNRKRRDPTDATSRGARIKSLEDSIANLDTQQSAAVVETFDGVQRLRGLAGSGKTIVLALKVAYLHARHPEWLIAVTFNTRSLKKLFESLITTFVLEQTNEEPNWEQVRIMNAWGAPGGKERIGLYYEFCVEHGVEHLDFIAARERFGRDKEFDSVCELALQQRKAPHPKYDAILVDEAQDFSPQFLLLCYEFLKEPKRLVYAYDELQNLGRSSLPPPEDIFGKNERGEPRVRFQARVAGKARQDIVLDVCYRNSRPVLVTAHALGFGVYRPPAEGLAQIFQDNDLWLDIGYHLADGTLKDGARVVLERTPHSSPSFLEEHSSMEDLVVFRPFADSEEQTEWLVASVRKNIEEDGLLPEDIIVINPDPISTRRAVGAARKQLLQLGINSTLAGVTSSADVFVQPGSVTFTGVFRAKGNEAAMVYVINAQDCVRAAYPRDTARVRNRLFTAITRSKAWVRVVGCGVAMEELCAEFERIRNAKFRLDFVCPTEAQRKSMNIVNRDMSSDQKEMAQMRRANLADLVDALDAGDAYIQDFPPEMIEKLRKMIEQEKKKA